MKKIGILTLHNALNYGAFLQAFALQTVLQEQHYEVKIIDLSKNRFFSRLWLIKCRYPKKMIHHYKLLKQFDKVFNTLNIIHNHIQDFDTIIVGSDEVWNLGNNFIHYKEYFGKGLMVSNLISYAVSTNSLTPEYFRQLAAGSNYNFSEFKHLSVRDINTFKLVKAISSREPTIVLDPTLLFTGWHKLATLCPHKNFIFLYEIGIKEQEKEKIIHFARKTGKKIISIGCDITWCDENIYGTPFDFLGYIMNADFVITSQFHGVLFSLIFNKEFVIFPQGKAKVLDVMEWAGLKDRDATNVPDLEYIFAKPMNYDEINKLIAKCREDSLQWLIKSI